ncbi:MAG TPA: hypothetical protein VJ739_18995 [Gemmataceae bacterium]|nr:hypothetical protein [Gemmataceae bacterium]
MPNPVDWERCLFRDDALLERPDVHDNFVYALAVHLEQHVLVLHTQYRDGPGLHELTDVRFRGLIAHHFEDVVAPSILLDIERVPPGWVVEQWKGLFDSRKNYGWPPLEYTDLVDLIRRLAELRVFGYRIMGSCGLDGFVLASEAEYRQRKDPVEEAEQEAAADQLGD